MSDITFDTVKLERDINELYRMKIELTQDSSELHELYHSGNSKMTKSEILSEINFNKEMIEYLNVRIKDRRQEIYIEEKEQRYHLKQFKDLCRERLSPELFKELDTESRKT
jgi:hypothetical protein